MKVLRFSAIIVVTASLFFQSCTKEDSSTVDQDRIYTDYEVFYNSNTDKTTVLAKFRFGGATGTNLELIAPAEVRFNGTLLPYNVVLRGHFREFAGLVDSGQFVYQNADGTLFTNDLPAFDAIAFPAEFDTIFKSRANTLTWVGTPLADEQRVNLFIGTWTWGQDALYSESALGAEEMVLGTARLQALAEVNSTCYLDRITETALAEQTAVGGLIRGI